MFSTASSRIKAVIEKIVSLSQEYFAIIGTSSFTIAPVGSFKVVSIFIQNESEKF